MISDFFSESLASKGKIPREAAESFLAAKPSKAVVSRCRPLHDADHALCTSALQNLVGRFRCFRHLPPDWLTAVHPVYADCRDVLTFQGVLGDAAHAVGGGSLGQGCGIPSSVHIQPEICVHSDRKVHITCTAFTAFTSARQRSTPGCRSSGHMFAGGASEWKSRAQGCSCTAGETFPLRNVQQNCSPKACT